jgi:hypothetical protein
MTKEAFLKKVKKKFGTYSDFARAIGMERYDWQLLMARKDLPKATMDDLEKKLNDLPDPGDINDDPRMDVLKAKITEAGGPYAFCKANPTFNMRQVYEVFNGQRLRESKLVRSLFVHFGIHNLEAEGEKT